MEEIRGWLRSHLEVVSEHSERVEDSEIIYGISKPYEFAVKEYKRGCCDSALEFLEISREAVSVARKVRGRDMENAIAPHLLTIEKAYKVLAR